MKMTRKQCYYCGEQIGSMGSKEHVPPQMMFVSGTSSITVPACQKHNQDKSYKDAVIVTFLLRSAKIEWRKPRTIPLSVKTALANLQDTINRLAKMYPDVPILAPMLQDIIDFPDIPYIPKEMDIKEWMRQITAGLVYNALNGFEQSINWGKTDSFSPTYLENNDPPFTDAKELAVQLSNWGLVRTELENYYWFDGWSSGPNPYDPKIYRFQVSFLPDFVYFKHLFCDSVDWYVRFKASPSVRKKLRAKLE